MLAKCIIDLRSTGVARRVRGIEVRTLMLIAGLSLGCDPGDDSWARYLETKQYDGGAPGVCPASGSIMVSSPRSGHGDIYAYDGSGRREPLRLTSDEAFESHPVCSPDGKWIVYSKEARGYANLWIMLRDGSRKRRLTSGPVFDHPRGFAADGSVVRFIRAYPSAGMARSADWHQVRLDGSGLTKGEGGTGARFNMGLSISVPGGRAYDFGRDGKMAVRRNGEAVEVVDLPRDGIPFPTLDLERKRIVFSAIGPGGSEVEIYQVDIETDRVSRLW